MFFKHPYIPDFILQKLIRGCIAGERTCQKEIYELYGQKMMGLCLRYARNREEAEEIMQDGFLQLYKCINQYRNTGSFEGWLRRIMINCALQRYRGKMDLFQFTSLTEENYIFPTDDDSLARLSEKELIRLIQTLPPATDS